MRSLSQKETPKASARAKGVSIARVEAKATTDTYSNGQCARKPIEAIGPAGRFTVKGQKARTLVALVSAGGAGVTALEMSSWALRLAAYVKPLRDDFGLSIETVRELHDGGWHGRYVLHTPVSIVEDAR